MEESDEALLEAVLSTQDHAAFARLVRRHAGRFRRLAYRFTGSVEDAEDIVQEAFLKLWRSPGSFSGARQSKFTTWLHRVVVNRCIDHARRRKPLPLPEGFEAVDERPIPESALESKQERTRVERAFRDLPQKMQTSLNLGFYEALPHQEAAEIMNMGLKAFQSLLMRAKTLLREKVRRAYGT